MKASFSILVLAGSVAATAGGSAGKYQYGSAQGQSGGQYGGQYGGGQYGQAQAQSVTTVQTQAHGYYGGGGSTTTTTLMVHHTMTADYGSAVAQAAAATHTVTVGGAAGLVYTPSWVQANPGDVVWFNFGKSNHTLTQSTFAAPCVAAAGGVDSGFMPNPMDMQPGPSFSFKVASSDPTWFYCKQGNHCEQGMVFAINPTATKSFAQYLANAKGQGSASVASVATAATSTSSAATVMGTQVAGTTATDGSCSCFCGSMAFPNPAWGVGGFGGYPGVVSMT